MASLQAELESANCRISELEASKKALEEQVSSLQSEKVALTTKLEESGATDRSLLEKVGDWLGWREGYTDQSPPISLP